MRRRPTWCATMMAPTGRPSSVESGRWGSGPPLSPRSPWQNPYVERLIGTLWRDCWIMSRFSAKWHLRWVLTLYSLYYNETWTHLTTRRVDAPSNDLGPSSPHKPGSDCIIATCGYDFGMDRGEAPETRWPEACLGGCYPLSRSAFLPSRRCGPHPWADKFVPRHLSDGFGQFPFVYGVLLRTNSMASFLIGFGTVRKF